MKTLEVLIPVMNEEECLPELISRLADLRNTLSFRASLLVTFINDGSTDLTEKLLNDYSDVEKGIRFISLTRNFGHQAAITAGLDLAVGDWVAIMDADLQDPPEVIVHMLNKIEQGFDFVYGKRLVRRGETVFKKASARFFYWSMRKICRVDIPSDTGDFRLMSAKVVEGLRRMPEKHRFLRGMIPWMGFKGAPVFYERDARFGGVTKFGLGKMIQFSLDAALSFSFFPLRLSTYVGFACTFLGLLGGALMLYFRFFTDFHVPGITAVILTVVLMNGIQNIILGISGEYIGRLYEEAKGRPTYYVEYTRNVDERVEAHAPGSFKKVSR
jgi:glycosyltransferase involved in cell wall biosynthesis